MIILKLLGYSLGSVVMYWGTALLAVTFWLLLVTLLIVVNQAWNKITGTNDDWQWFLGWLDAVGNAIHAWKLEWIGWIPGMLIQVWYAGYAATLVQVSTREASTEYAIAINATGMLGIVIAAAVFYWIYEQVVDLNLERWVYIFVGGVSLSAYCVLLTQPQAAALLSESWQRVFFAFLAGLLEALFW